MADDDNVIDGLGITDEQYAKVITLQEDLGKDDFQRCKTVLQNLEWDVDAAARQIMEDEHRFVENVADDDIDTSDDELTGLGRFSDYQPHIDQIIQPPPGYEQLNQNEPIRDNPGAAAPSFWNSIMLPLDTMYNWLCSIFEVFWRFFHSLITPGDHMIDQVANQTRIAEEITQFRAEYDTKYGAEHPVFYLGGFDSASKDCVREGRFLMCYFHDFSKSECSRVANNILSAETVRQVLNTGQILFWACRTDTPEGQRVMRKLNVTNIPQMVFLAPVVNPFGNVGRYGTQMKLRGRITEPILFSVPDLIEKIFGLVSANTEYIQPIQEDRRRTVVNRDIRAEQDEEYLRSLRADQERDKKRQEEEKRDKERLLRLEQKAERREEQRNDLLKNKELAKTRLSIVDEVDASTVRIVLKFPDGARHERKFLPSDPIQSLYYFALSQEITPAKFSVTQTHPRREVKCMPTDPVITLEESAIKNEMLFINFDEETSSEEEEDFAPMESGES